MSGSSKSINMATFISARIAGTPNYVPAHIPAGGNKPIRQRCEFSVYQNINDKSSRFRITAFGKMADVLAKSGATGKEVTLITKINSYPGRIPLTDAQGNTQFVTDPSTGQPLTIEKTGFVLDRLSFGADSDKTVAEEIQAGKRPQFWNINGHQDAMTWKQVCQNRNAEVYQQGSTVFGFAKVSIPQGAQIVDPNTINNAATQFVGNTSAVNAGFANVAAAVVNPATVVNPANPVMVNGQNMGFAPANNGAMQNNQGVNTGMHVQGPTPIQGNVYM